MSQNTRNTGSLLATAIAIGAVVATVIVAEIQSRQGDLAAACKGGCGVVGPNWTLHTYVAPVALTAISVIAIVGLRHLEQRFWSGQK